MKFIEMNNEQVADALIRISDPLENLCSDPKLDELIDKYKKLKDEPLLKTIGAIVPMFITLAIKDHKTDLFEIISVIIGKPVKTIEKMNILDTIKEVRESWNEVLTGFFQSTIPQASKEEEKS